MGHHQAAATPKRPPTTYCLQVRGPLPASLADQLDGFTVHTGPTTTLTGPVTDAAHLYGLIARLESLGLTLLSVQPSTSSPTSHIAEPDVTHPGKEHPDD